MFGLGSFRSTIDTFLIGHVLRIVKLYLFFDLKLSFCVFDDYKLSRRRCLFPSCNKASSLRFPSCDKSSLLRFPVLR